MTLGKSLSLESVGVHACVVGRTRIRQVGQTGRADRETDRQAGQTGRPTDRWGRQEDRQIGRADRKTDR